MIDVNRLDIAGFECDVVGRNEDLGHVVAVGSDIN